MGGRCGCGGDSEYDGREEERMGGIDERYMHRIGQYVGNCGGYRKRKRRLILLLHPIRSPGNYKYMS
jgi:hypothetical protein